MRGKFDATAAGQQHIVDLLTTLATESVREFIRREPDEDLMKELFASARYVSGTFDQAEGREQPGDRQDPQRDQADRGEPGR